MTSETPHQHDVVIIGAGIAGASLSYFLRTRGVTDVVIVEREEHACYHSTGRSAAVLVEYSPDPIHRRLIRLGAEFLRRPPPGFAEEPLLDPIGVLVVGKGAAWASLSGLARTMVDEGTRVELLDASQALARVPALLPTELDGALLLPDDGHLDVHALHGGYLREHVARGGAIRFGAEVTRVLVEGGHAVGVETTAGSIRARWVVDAAGAWVEAVARTSGAPAIAFVPKRRTVITFAAPADRDMRRWPMVEDPARGLYVKPESGGLLASPMDATPDEPRDVHATDEDAALTVERLEALAPELAPRALRRRWAGLRTFSPDEAPVVGEDPILPGFFWLAGQAGIGIETSPALGRIAADLLVTGRTSAFDAALLAPARFRS